MVKLSCHNFFKIEKIFFLFLIKKVVTRQFYQSDTAVTRLFFAVTRRFPRVTRFLNTQINGFARVTRHFSFLLLQKKYETSEDFDVFRDFADYCRLEPLIFLRTVSFF